MSFTNPNALFLLLLLPVLIVVGWPRLAYRRRRDAVSLIVRLLLVTLVIIGLAGIQVQRAADKLAVVFLIDASDSIPPAMQSAAIDYVRDAADVMGDKDQAAVVVFGADALVETPVTDRLELVQIGSDPIRLNTDLAEAIRLGLALFPADTAKRMVILSDGRQTVGDAEEVARLAAATDVQIDYVVLSSVGVTTPQAAGPEVMIAQVDVPATVNEGERFNLTLALASTRPDSPVEIRILSGGEVIHRREAILQQGTTNEVFEVIAPDAGFVDFQVVIEPRSADTFYQNNQLSAFTEVTGPPRVLLVTSDEREIESLRAVLEESGLQVDVQGPRDLPLGLAPLSSYDSIVLANVSALDLTQERMEYLQAYVRDLGGGLVAIGGPQSFGVGGYFETPLEETLPVEMRIRDQQRIPQLTLLFVIDRSGSMEISSSGMVSNLELAKEAIIRSYDLLNDTDRTGLLSFDVAAYKVDIQDVGDEANRENLRQLVGALRPGGGTNILQAVLAADEMLRADPSQLKHIILLTDGGADPGGIVPAVDRMYQNYGITTSVVAVGQNYAQWLHDVATAGNGQFHLAYDISTIPAIFTAETVLATRSYIFEEEFTPALAARHPIMDGFDSLPPLLGYIATTDKATATAILRGPEDDPILAAWQYGLGRSVAFMSDATSRWASAWIDWEGYADFWNQAVRWTISEGSANNIELRVVERGEQAVLVADVRDNQGNYLNGLNLEAAVINTDLETTRLALQQTAPGRYEAVFTPEEEGAYFITTAGSTPEGAEVLAQQSVVQTTGWVLSYSAEYRVSTFETGQEDPANLLARIARITGGTSLQNTPERAFEHNLNQEQAAQPIWPYFVLAALLLLPFDVAIRRLVVTRTDLQKARDAIALPFRREPVQLSEESSARLERLRGAKGRARSTSTEELVQPFELPTPPPQPSEKRTRKTRRTAVPPPLAKPAPPEEPAAAREGTLASKLLERRRTTQDRDKIDE